mmetsp:Transcript_97255/g.251429  ORF Transcript_97255/g.251429 Transcript_97255/m.251429 type:complete len:203 (+) Transcript_97255:88-696(+)
MDHQPRWHQCRIFLWSPAVGTKSSGHQHNLLCPCRLCGGCLRPESLLRHPPRRRHSPHPQRLPVSCRGRLRSSPCRRPALRPQCRRCARRAWPPAANTELVQENVSNHRWDRLVTPLLEGSTSWYHQAARLSDGYPRLYRPLVLRQWPARAPLLQRQRSPAVNCCRLLPPGSMTLGPRHLLLQSQVPRLVLHRQPLPKMHRR